MQRVLFWLAIGMLGAAVPAAAEALRVSNCMTSNRQITAFYVASCPTTGPTPGVPYSVPACGTVVLDCTTCKIGMGSQTCATAGTWSDNRTFGKFGFVPTSDLERIVRTKNEPEQEWRWDWPEECECNIDSMQW